MVLAVQGLEAVSGICKSICDWINVLKPFQLPCRIIHQTEYFDFIEYKMYKPSEWRILNFYLMVYFGIL